jgi:FtsZ-interacting cell division protein ZipA
MSVFNYRAEAELFPTKNRRSKSAPFAYRRFERAADAIRFAVEDLPADAFAGAYLEVGEVRFDRRGIRELYDHAEYPHARKLAPLAAEQPAQPVAAQAPQPEAAAAHPAAKKTAQTVAKQTGAKATRAAPKTKAA